MKIAGWAVLSVLLCAPLAAQEKGRFSMDLVDFDDKADQVLELNLEGKRLDEGRKLLAVRENVSKSFTKVLSGLTGIYRRTPDECVFT